MPVNEYISRAELKELNLTEFKRKWNGPYNGADTTEWQIFMKARVAAHLVYKEGMHGLSKEFEENRDHEGIGRKKALAIFQRKKKPVEIEYDTAFLKAQKIFNSRYKR